MAASHGKTWMKITSGINDKHFTRVIRADPKRRGLLYAGTESGMYVSFDEGANWKSFQLNLPIVPITDLALKENDLIVATQGRSFWVMDDLTVLHQLTESMAARSYFVYTPRPSYRMRGSSPEEAPKGIGENAPNGVMVHYYFKEQPDSSTTSLRILEANGKIIKSYSPKAKEKSEQMPLKVGMNRFVWNMRYPEAEKFENLILWGGGTQGPKAVPGNYQARLIVSQDSMTVPFTIVQDPRATAPQADLVAQFDFLMGIRDKLVETHKAIKQIREVRKQVEELNGRAKSLAGADTIKAVAKGMLGKMTKVEEALYQTKNQSSQDPLNFPIRLNNKLSALGFCGGVWRFSPDGSSRDHQE